VELARRFEPGSRRVARMRNHDARLRRVLDTSDVCQSIMRMLKKQTLSGANNSPSTHCKANQHRSQARLGRDVAPV